MAQNFTSETRNVSGFDRVVLDDFGELTIHQGDVESLTIETTPELLDRIKTEVENGTLKIGIKSWLDRIFTTPFDRRQIRYTLMVENLSSVRISGAVIMRAASLTATQFELGVSGTADITIDELTTETLRVGTSGSSDMRLAGRVQSQELRISGSGKYLAANLESRRAEVHISGTGSAEVWAAESLNVRLSGAGMVKYKGDPRVTQSISGAGSVSKLES